MRFETLLYAKQGDGILWLRLRRPQVLNAINCALARELREAMEAAAADPGVLVVILTGEGRAFCSGDDLKEEAAGVSATERQLKVDNLQRVAWAIRSMKKPVIAAVNGYAMGGGCEIALDCDLLIASEEAMFGFPETGVGGTLTGGATFLLPLAVGLAKAKELVFLGDRIDAAEALRLGLVNKVVPAAELEPAATAMAQRILSKSQFAVALSKSCLNVAAETSFSVALAYEADAANAALAGEDFREGARTFVLKGSPPSRRQ